MRSVLLTFTCFAIAAAQDPTQVNVRHHRDWNASATSGWCTVKVWVDEDAEFALQGEKLSIRTVAGRPGRDVATECSSPLPSTVEVFRLKTVDGRGSVELTDDPSRSRGNKATVRVKDPRAGAEEFAFRLEWERGTFSSDRPPANPPSDTPRPPLNDDRRVITGWRTSDLRQEIERIYNDLMKRYPAIDVIDGYIDRVRFDRWTFADIAKDIDRRR